MIYLVVLTPTIVPESDRVVYRHQDIVIPPPSPFNFSVLPNYSTGIILFLVNPISTPFQAISSPTVGLYRSIYLLCGDAHAQAYKGGVLVKI